MMNLKPNSRPNSCVSVTGAQLKLSPTLCLVFLLSAVFHSAELCWTRRLFFIIFLLYVCLCFSSSPEPSAHQQHMKNNQPFSDLKRNQVNQHSRLHFSVVGLYSRHRLIHTLSHYIHTSRIISSTRTDNECRKWIKQTLLLRFFPPSLHLPLSYFVLMLHMFFPSGRSWASSVGRSRSWWRRSWISIEFSSPACNLQPARPSTVY